MTILKALRLIKLDSPLQSIIWSVRVARWSRTFPRSYKEFRWEEPPCVDGYYMALDTWKFLETFFDSRGYVLYQKVERSASMVPAPSPGPAEHTFYPFARLIIKDVPPEQYWGSPTTWAARDKLGREVMIKAISDASNPSDELKILLRLNSEELRSDPYNHTIPILDFLTFDELVFVVMPRWDAAFAPDFATVSELMEITKTFLEVFVFLHKHKIVHHDFLEQNTGMNYVIPVENLFRYKGLRNPGEARYVLFDFNNAIMYPEDSVIEDMVATRRLNFELRRASPVKGPYNPFKADMAFLGLVLELKVRHIEHIVPELGPFFDRLVDTLDPSQFTANQALSRFMEIYDALSPEQLQEPVDTWLWINGESTKKYKD